MYRHVSAFDFDGTLAENGRVPLVLQQALAELHQDNFALFLVTGRQYGSIELGSLGDVFTGIVWENGAVLTLNAIDDLYLPFGYIDARLITALETAGVPLEHGTAIVSTWMPHKETVWQVHVESGTDADIVTSQPGPAGVLEALQTYWLNKQPSILPSRQEHLISLGLDDNDKPVSLLGASLISQNLGIFGDSGSGKSWTTGLLIEEMHLAGFQVLVIDADGDFRNLRSLPRMVAFSGDEKVFPTPEQVTAILGAASISVVLDLCSYPIVQRQSYITDLRLALRPLKEHTFRPHWIVLEEAQHFLPPVGNEISVALQPLC